MLTKCQLKVSAKNVNSKQKCIYEYYIIVGSNSLIDVTEIAKEN